MLRLIRHKPTTFFFFTVIFIFLLIFLSFQAKQNINHKMLLIPSRTSNNECDAYIHIYTNIYTCVDIYTHICYTCNLNSPVWNLYNDLVHNRTRGLRLSAQWKPLQDTLKPSVYITAVYAIEGGLNLSVEPPREALVSFGWLMTKIPARKYAGFLFSVFFCR